MLLARGICGGEGVVGGHVHGRYLVGMEIKCIFANEIFRESSRKVNGSVAQLNRASDYGSEGYRFESCRGHHQQKRRTTRGSTALFVYQDSLHLSVDETLQHAVIARR